MIVKKTNNVWYIGGLHFSCTQCGWCCSGPQEGVIWITRPEIQLLADRLGITISQLRKNHLKRVGFRLSIKEDPCSKDCIFLTDINGFKGCTIYDVRPMQCRTWPFWPGNLQSPDDWNAAATKCPGINKGRLYTFDEIKKIKNQKQWCSVDKTALICDNVAKIYDWLDANLKPFSNQCSACGKCCDFGSFGHKLFVTSPELLYFRQNVKNSKPMSAQICPHNENGKCTARNYRFAGCRIFFCKADKNLQNKLCEKTINKFKLLCDKFDFPYRYVDLFTALNLERDQ